MWNLTPDYLANAKEELKGRRAAIQARTADELKAIEADLEEIETLERAAYAFAVKHVLDMEPEQTATSPPELEEEVEPAPAQVAALEPAPTDLHRNDHESVPKDGSLSRWRIRSASKTETENA
jgi:hypothetical protein